MYNILQNKTPMVRGFLKGYRIMAQTGLVFMIFSQWRFWDTLLFPGLLLQCPWKYILHKIFVKWLQQLFSNTQFFVYFSYTNNHFYVLVPSPVQQLSYTVINESTICLHWREPQKKYGDLQSYIISFTPDKNIPLENWLNISIPAYQHKPTSCWSDNKRWLPTEHATISMVLGNLTSETQYMLLVRAISQVGIGQPPFPITIDTNIMKSLDQTSSKYKQQLGNIMLLINVNVIFNQNYCIRFVYIYIYINDTWLQVHLQYCIHFSQECYYQFLFTIY